MQHPDIKMIVGLGNPGVAYAKNRHNIGFMVLDALAELHHASWHHKELYDVTEICLGSKQILLVKPLTFMNNVGSIMPHFTKKGIRPEQVLVIHDELEKPQGNMQVRLGGSARGHNGLRSIISYLGEQFYRLRFGIGRPERKEDVGRWVLSDFSLSPLDLQVLIDKAIAMIAAQA